MTEIEEALVRVAMMRANMQGAPNRELRKDRQALGALISALSASQAEVERLTRERDEAEGRSLENNMLAHKWMVAHDRLKAGEPYDLPTPADLPAAEARATRAEAERDALHLAICGGEDAPGYAASLSHETVLKVLADNYASAKRDSELAWDGETANTWKARATRAEGLLEEAGEVSNRLLAWANRRCPCYDDSPSPCPLCGARVDATDENGVCKAAEYTVPGDLLQVARAFLDKLKGEG